MFNKNITPNLIALLAILISFVLPDSIAGIVRTLGLFALSVALTNWLAIHMLFERVPGLYGSGVIPLHFEEFKSGILVLVTKHLFSEQVVNETLLKDKAQEGNQKNFDIEPFIAGLDLDVAYDQLKMTIMESSFGAMLGMVGGSDALETMREPFKTRMKKFLGETARSEAFQNAVHAQINSMATSDDFREKIARVVETRLEQLTPEMVKDIVEEMIRKHLGWLVVWGAVFGALIGLISALTVTVL